MTTEPTISDVLVILKEVKNDMQGFKNEVKGSFQDVTESVQGLATHIDERFGLVDQRFNRIEATMVTKDYLDRKMFDLRGDLVGMIRTEDQKVDALVDELADCRVINGEVSKRIKALAPLRRSR